MFACLSYCTHIVSWYARIARAEELVEKDTLLTMESAVVTVDCMTRENYIYHMNWQCCSAFLHCYRHMPLGCMARLLAVVCSLRRK